MNRKHDENLTAEQVDRELRLLDAFASPAVDETLVGKVCSAVEVELWRRRLDRRLIQVLVPIAAAACIVLALAVAWLYLDGTTAATTAANGYAQVEVTEDSEPIDLELDALAEQVLAANRIGLNGADGLWYDAAYGELEYMDRDF
ncbi:MAG: hypothetical protein GXY33_20850 [Phycisphaerae bacterium]|nr:hypothetical protein [Phycisphaerae bacterium]